MRLIDRYLFRQLLSPLVLATAALTAVAVLSQSLRGLDIIVEKGQTALTFGWITVLAMPQLVNLILPIALFVAALVALNRLHTENEIVVCFAGGMSRWRIAYPVLRLATYAAFISLILGLWVQPLAQRTMRDTLFAIQGDLVATLVKEGKFTQPAEGLTVYAGKVDADGLIHDLFIHQQKPSGGSTTYSSQRGRLGKLDQAPVLVMEQGSSEEFSAEGRLNYLSFDRYVFDLNAFIQHDALVHYKISDRYPHELFFPDFTQQAEQRDRVKMLAEGHSRYAAPLYNIAFAAMALAAVVGGAFSRTGYGRRIAVTAVAAVLVRIVGFAVQAACANSEWLNLAQYAVPAAATAWAMSQLFRQKVSRFITTEHHRGARDLFSGAPT